MATAAELKPDQNYRVPHGFFTSGLSEIDPAVEDARFTVKLAKTDVAVSQSEATSIFNREMDLAYLGKKPVQDAMKTAKAEIDPLLEGGERCG